MCTAGCILSGSLSTLALVSKGAMAHRHGLLWCLAAGLATMVSDESPPNMLARRSGESAADTCRFLRGGIPVCFMGDISLLVAIMAIMFRVWGLGLKGLGFRN